VAKHRKNKNKRPGKVRRLSKVGLLVGGFALAQSVVLATATADPTVVFIDGHNYPGTGARMANQLTGKYQAPLPCSTCTPLQEPNAGNTKYFVQYPADLGWLDGFGAPTGDQSIAIAQQNLQDYLAGHPPSATNPTTVVGYSEGAVAVSHEVSNWGPGEGIAFVLIADPERPNGGILSRFPAGTYIPFLGITAGNATPSTDAPVVMVTRRYDGVADAPAYPVNVLADANAFLGFYYLHDTYDTVDPNDPDNIVTESGNMTDILVPAPEGELPILMPFGQIGVPQPILVALDPATRALIETGYNRTDDPAQQVRFGLLPPPTAWPGDVQMVVVGFVKTGQRLPGAVFASVPGAPGTFVVAPLNRVAPTSSPLTPAPAPVDQVDQPTARLVSNVQPAQEGTTSKPETVAAAPAPGSAPSSNSSLRQLNPVQTTLKNPFALQPPSGNQAATSSPSTGNGSSPNVGKPLQGAVSNVTNAIGSAANDFTRSISRGSSSKTDPGPASNGSTPSNDNDAK
jgi:hypothetical protein